MKSYNNSSHFAHHPPKFYNQYLKRYADDPELLKDMVRMKENTSFGSQVLPSFIGFKSKPLGRLHVFF